MRWLGIGLMLAGVVAALTAGFVFKNVPFVIGSVVFFIIGVILFFYGSHSLPK